MYRGPEQAFWEALNRRAARTEGGSGGPDARRGLCSETYSCGLLNIQITPVRESREYRELRVYSRYLARSSGTPEGPNH
jgi:hypothetical protein